MTPINIAPKFSIYTIPLLPFKSRADKYLLLRDKNSKRSSSFYNTQNWQDHEISPPNNSSRYWELPVQGKLKTSKSSNWYSQKKLHLEGLIKNWQDPEINCPNKWSIDWASEALEILRKIDFPCDRIAASVDEGVCISFISKKNKNKYADIEFFNNHEILAAKSDQVSRPKIWQISVDEISETLEEIREYIEV